MANLIDILINAKWRGEPAIKDATGDLKKLENQADKTSTELKKQKGVMAGLSEGYLKFGLVMGAAGIAIGTATVAIKKLFAAIRGGAELEQVQIRFDRLAQSISTTGDALRDDLSIATQGMISDAQSMALATDLMALGLTKTHDETIRLASAASQLGFDMNQLVLTLTNQTTMRFDALGVAVDGFQEKVKALEDAGHDANEAFKLAFVEQAEEQIERVGSRAEETAGKLDIIASSWTELLDTFKTGTAEFFGPIIDFIAEALVQNKEVLEAERLVDEARMQGRISAEDYRALIILGKESTALYVERVLELAEGIKRVDRSVAEADERLMGWTTTTDEGVISWKEMLKTLGLTEEKVRELAAAASDIDFSMRFVGGADFITDAVGQVISDAAQPRADIWLDFQTDLTDITSEESENRAITEARYEERRTDLVDTYGQQRTRLEERSALSINRIREQSSTRQAKIQEDGNRRLAELEEDHLDRIQEIIENADLQLQDAAGRLDAAAVARIQRQREDALGDEEDSYKKQNKKLKDETGRRLEAEKEAAAERIKLEEENNAIRLAEMETAHQDQLNELKEKHDDELTEIKDNAVKARLEREDQYIEERIQLGDHGRAKSDLARQWMNTILIQEEAFWESRMGLVTGGTAGPIDPGDSPTGQIPGGDPDDKPSRLWLESTALRVAKPNSTESAFAWSRHFKSLSDAELARWIERNSDIDVQGYALGGRVTDSGLALVGESGPELIRLPSGSEVFEAGLTRQFFSRAGGMNVGELNVIVNESERPGETGREVREELIRLFEEMA
jgi:hypothetical protein